MTSEPMTAESTPQPPERPETLETPEKRRLHPAATLIDAAGILRAVLFPIIIVTFGQGVLFGVGLTLLVVIVGSILAAISWRTEVYFVSGGSLHHQSGVIRHREQVVPASRISALDTQRGVIQRAFGIVSVHVQTAGGSGKAEVVLRALTFADAEQLRLDLGHRATQAVPGAPPAATEPAVELIKRPVTDGTRREALTGSTPAGSPGPVEASVASAAAATAAAPTFYSSNLVVEEAPVVFEMTPRQLLVAALTSPSIAVVGAAGAGLASFAQDAIPSSVADDLADRAQALSVMAVLVVTVAIIVLAAAASIVGTALMYGGFRVTRDSTRLRVRRGILTERVGTVPLDRIHGIRVIESPLRQLLGYASIEVEVAGYAGQDEVARTLVPLVRRAELADTLQAIVPGYVWPEGPLTGVPARAHRRYLTAPVLISLVPAVLIAVAPIGYARGLALVPVALAVLLGLRAARDAGWRRDDGTLTLRWRTFALHTVVAPERRLQRASASANPFQRRALLATFAVRLSSARQASIKHLDAEVAHHLMGSALTHRTRA